jgi:CRP/FNR family transcriptional regulator
MNEPNRGTGRLSLEDPARIPKDPVFLPGLPLEAAHRLTAVSTRLLYAEGTTVFNQGDHLPGVFVVAQGALRVYRTDDRGNVQVIDTLTPGTCVGEVQALDGGGAASSAAAQGDTECWIIPADALRAMVREDPEVALCIIQNLAGKVRHLLSLIESLELHSVPERVGRVILEHQGHNPCRTLVEFQETQGHLAQHIGASRVCFNRALRSLSKEGLIQNTFPVVRILDYSRLHRFAGINRSTFSYGSGFSGTPAATPPTPRAPGPKFKRNAPLVSLPSEAPPFRAI